MHLEKALQTKDIILTDSVRLSKVSAISVHCCKSGGVAWLKKNLVSVKKKTSIIYPARLSMINFIPNNEYILSHSNYDVGWQEGSFKHT